MYERFTDNVRKVLNLANQESQRLNHEYIGTEHILLGIARVSDCAAALILNSFGNFDLLAVSEAVWANVKAGDCPGSLGKLPQTPGAKKVIERAIHEARNFGHNYVGTEHILLGLIGEGDGIAAKVLLALGVTAVAVRFWVVEHRSPESSGTPQPHVEVRTADAYLDLVRNLIASGVSPDLAAKASLEVLGVRVRAGSW